MRAAAGHCARLPPPATAEGPNPDALSHPAEYRSGSCAHPRGHDRRDRHPRPGNRITADYQNWCADNGVWGGTYPGDRAYLAWLKKLAPHADRCLFAVAPDVVGNHWATFARSQPMLRRIRDLGYPVAFAAQNYMEFDSWDPWDEIDCLFIAGDTAWKLGPEAANLAAVASSLGKWVHMGRVNSKRRFDYAHAIGCDSVDGTHITRHPTKNLAEVLHWSHTAATQQPLFAI